jgi:hypothetical protein
MNVNRKDLERKLGRAPRGVTRIWIGDEPWHIRTGDTAIACYQPLTSETFGLQIGNLDLSNQVAVKKAILNKAAELRRLKRQNQSTKEVTTELLFTNQ